MKPLSPESPLRPGGEFFRFGSIEDPPDRSLRPHRVQVALLDRQSEEAGSEGGGGGAGGAGSRSGEGKPVVSK